MQSVSPDSRDQHWIVTIDSGASLKSVEETLSHIGFGIVQIFDQLGGLEVRGPEALVPKARALAGIADVSPSGAFDIGPPGAPDS